MSNIYRNYWASSSTSEDPVRAPRAGFQTLWVQKQLARLRAREEALRAQHIESTDTF